MKKFKIFLIILLIIILFGFLLEGIKTIYGYKMINKILSKTISNINKDNYYLEIKCTGKDIDTKTTAYYRNGIGRYVADNGVYTWTDGEDAYLIDEENKKVYVLSIENAPESLVSNDMFAYLLPGYNMSFWQKLKLSANIFNKFKSEKIDDEECYKISIISEKTTKTTWINKKSLSPIKTLLEFQNGDKLVYTYDLKFTATKLISVELPSFDGYKIIDYETGEILTDNLTIDDVENKEAQ